jgi:hypothetical protein
MKALLFFAVSLAASTAFAREKSPRNPPPPIISVPANAPADTNRYTYSQSPGTGRAPLVSPDQARAVIGRFKNGYPKIGGPRIAIYVNRELVDEASGLRLTGRTERTDSLRTDLQPTGPVNGQLGQNVTVVGNVQGGVPPQPLKGTQDRTEGQNTFSHTTRPGTPLPDRQTVRDVERLMGRPLRMGGAKLADQRVANQLLADRPVQEFLGTTGTAVAAKDREALQKVADVIIEVLVSSRPITVPQVSGNQVFQAPDIQATAIRLDNAQIVGQAATRDIIGPDQFSGRFLRTYDVQEITEAVALALMEDMMQGIE